MVVIGDCSNPILNHGTHGHHGIDHSEKQLFDFDLGLAWIAEARPARAFLFSVVSVVSVVKGCFLGIVGIQFSTTEHTDTTE